MVRTFKFASAALLAALTLIVANTAWAQTGPAGQMPAPGKPGVQTGMPFAPVGLSEADLVNFLRSLDPNVQTRKINNGSAYDLKIERDGWRFLLTVESLGSVVWVETNLGNPMSNADQLPPAVLSQLLQANFKIGPSHFAMQRLNDGRVLLSLARCIDRAGLTTAYLQGQINQFCGHVRETHPTWNAVLAAAR
jgi:hypothetical protein